MATVAAMPSLHAQSRASRGDDRTRRLAYAGGALLALSLASLGLLVAARPASGGRLRGP